MRRFVVFLQIALLGACGNSWISHSGEAREHAQVEAIRRPRHRTRPAHAAQRRPLDQVRHHRRQRPRRSAATRDRGADGRVSPALRLQVRADGRRQHLRRPGDRGRLSPEVRGAVQTAARRRRQVLRRARQPRRYQPDLLQAVQHGRPSLLHVRAAGRSDHAVGHARTLLRAGQHVSQLGADSVVREGSRPSRAPSGRSRSCIIRSTRPAATRWRRAAFVSRSSRPSSTAASTSFFPGTSTSTSAPSCRPASSTSSPAAPARCAPGTRRRRPRLRAATTRTITSCWPKSPTMDFSFRRSTASA